MKILITGASGLIGTRIVEMLGSKHEFIPVRQSEIDITHQSDIDTNLIPVAFDLLLHLAAYTNVDGAENNKELCQQINVEGTRNLFEMCKKKNAPMIHISTDFVFDGRGSSSTTNYTEYAVPNPISFYGQTKCEAEEIVKDKAMIIRTSYPYRKEFEGKRDFVRTIKYFLEQGKSVSMVDDALITPTYIDDFVNGIEYLIEHFSTEIYHVVGSDSLSPYEAGRLIAKNWNLDEDLIQPITYEAYFKEKAPRPQWAKIVSTKNIGVSMSTFKEGLKKML